MTATNPTEALAGPLDGLKVIELASEHAALAGKMLGDLGADVVVVEPPGGHASRGYGPFADDVEGIEWGGPRRAVLEPGGSLQVSVAAEPRPAIALLMLPQRERGLRMDLIVRRNAGDEGVRGTVYCTPAR